LNEFFNFIVFATSKYFIIFYKILYFKILQVVKIIIAAIDEQIQMCCLNVNILLYWPHYSLYYFRKIAE